LFVSWTGPYILLNIFLSKIFNFISCEVFIIQVSLPQVTTGLIIVLYTLILEFLLKANPSRLHFMLAELKQAENRHRIIPSTLMTSRFLVRQKCQSSTITSAAFIVDLVAEGRRLKYRIQKLILIDPDIKHA
jgi:hypothetical protein